MRHRLGQRDALLGGVESRVRHGTLPRSAAKRDATPLERAAPSSGLASAAVAFALDGDASIDKLQIHIEGKNSF
jgi:hypothetical protein